MANTNDAGVEALRRLQQIDPPSLLAPNPSVSETARSASQYLFTTLRPFSPKSPLDELLVDGYDAEQIWHQIDLQSQPLLSTLRRRLNQFVKNPEEIAQFKVPLDVGKKLEKKKRVELEEEESDDFDEELDDDDDDFEGVEKKKAKGGSEGEDDFEEEDDEDEEGSEDEDDEEDEKEKVKGGGIEDKFLKIDELTEYLEKEEDNYEKGEERDEADEDSEEDDELEKAGEFEMDDEDDDDDDEEDEEAEDMGNVRYEDFFGGKNEKGSKRKDQLLEVSGDEDDMESTKQKRTASTYEKQREKIQSKIVLMEKANIEPKTWTMQGEVTASKRPINSAFEVDLDFEHNVRPTPVITEEVTASIEEMIQKKIVEGLFNDVQRAPKLPSKAPREVKQLDDNKSGQGLADLYEQEYVQKTDPTSAPLSFKDELKNEASTLFKKICLKLDALSHFNFAPKPVIEDMSFQTNVPALAMEEIAPVAVSDAAMLAPEEVFDGKGDVKEEAELTQAERKRRRANKKRKFKAEAVNKLEKKARLEKKADNAISCQVDGNFFIYPYMSNAALTSHLLLNLSHMFIFYYQPHFVKNIKQLLFQLLLYSEFLNAVSLLHKLDLCCLLKQRAEDHVC
ncbi:Mpp10 protein [Medicago truncatula]|uniref:U3 small nucleolar ribonucleoprotein protein MPP10 n=2 Tax=Medicago truncatula TaxID=3880 RepID=A0A072V143_MEDTR|nr:Mpp10 protein [Medicago truncatula]